MKHIFQKGNNSSKPTFLLLHGTGGNPYGTSVTVGQDGKMIEDPSSCKTSSEMYSNRR